ARGSSAFPSVRDPAVRAVASPPDSGSHAGTHRPLAGDRPEPDDLRRDGPARSEVCQDPIVLGGPLDPVAHPGICRQWKRGPLTPIALAVAMGGRGRVNARTRVGLAPWKTER